jgi:putative endopeptidase
MPSESKPADSRGQYDGRREQFHFSAVARTRFSVVVALICCVGAGVVRGAGTVHARTTHGPASADTIAHGIDVSDLDTTCAACDNFYAYATGGWQAHHPIPATSSSNSTEDAVEARNQAIVREVLEFDTGKVGLLYATCMDSSAIEQEGLTPIARRLRRIAAITTLNDVRHEAAALQHTYYVESTTDIGIPVVFIIRSRVDPTNTSRAILVVEQGGLGALARDTYLGSDSPSQALRAEYVRHLMRTFLLAGDDSSAAMQSAQRTMTVETALARISRSRSERRRDPLAVYHPMTMRQAIQLAPHLNWPAWLRAAGVEPVATLNIADPTFFHGLDSLLVHVSMDDWRAYLRGRLLTGASPWLDSRFQAEDLRMRSALSGVSEQLPRWRRCASVTDDVMGVALGEAFAARTFTPAAKARVHAMVAQLKQAFRLDIETLGWMSPSTRRNALAKLSALKVLVGYPDQQRDYSKLRIARGPFIDNWLTADEFEFQRQIAKIGRPVDRAEWDMSPAAVNAHSDHTLNNIEIPAGILQPPFFDVLADDAANYGAAGALIGHEMAHAFDDNGRKFDAAGNLRNWWTAEDSRRFQREADRIVDQFDQYVAIDSTHVNGTLTRSENIADLAGVKIAFLAFEGARRIRQSGSVGDVSARRFTPEQQFFLSYARFWAEKRRPEYAREQALVDQHAPGKWRVNGPLSNLPEFAAAFHCRADAAMVRPGGARVEIW